MLPAMGVLLLCAFAAAAAAVLLGTLFLHLMPLRASAADMPDFSYLGSFGLSVHYVRGSGAGGGTADCSYGGWMRVSQTTSYQQTGTMLHEPNHGVGVGTTSQWYNNPNLRSNTSSGVPL